MNRYIPIIGIEVHVELSTLSKMFCGCPANHFGKEPNSQTCPVCLGLPGALPVPNKKAIRFTQLIGAALGCKLKTESKFDRKHYFYPDLPKGYQISQYDQPLCVKGKLKSIRINRVHLEEDTGKLIHAKIKGKQVSLVDFNRSSIPLVEIVTEPDIHSSSKAKEYVKKIQQIIRYLGVSDCDMEKGSMRLEANVSVKRSNLSTKKEIEPLPLYKVEIKNLNSFKFLKTAIDYEINRQTRLLESDQTPVQETRGWNENQRKTISQRSKEEAQDYRYFPEPDIPPLKFTASQLNKIKSSLPELPQAKKTRFIKTFELNQATATTLTTNSNLARYFEQTITVSKDKSLTPQTIANYIINKKPNLNKTDPKTLIKTILSQKADLVTDSKTLQAWVTQVLKENQSAVDQYHHGKIEVLGFLIGQTQRKAQGKADAQKAKKLLLRSLDAKR